VRGEARARLGEVFAAALARRHPEAPEEELAKERARAERAPLVIAVIARIEADHHKIPAIEQVCSTAAAVQNMLLAAHALGYAAKWSTGANAYDPDVQAALGLGKDDRLIALLSIGHLAGPPPSPRRGDPAEHSLDWLGPGETRPLAGA
jgi:nitroreductase